MALLRKGGAYFLQPIPSPSKEGRTATSWRTLAPPGLFDFTTNYFQACDVALTNGLNKIMLSVTNLAVKPDCTSATTPPSLPDYSSFPRSNPTSFHDAGSSTDSRCVNTVECGIAARMSSSICSRRS
jgi:hypothetical protein